MDGAQGAWLTIDGRSVLNLCSNNYLNFATAPALKAAATAAIAAFGVGAGGARSVSGTQRLHVMLEQRLAEFKRVDAAMVLSSGFMANLAVVPALVGRGDRVYSDELNHASIVDACRLSGAEIVRYPHADATALGDLLGGCRRQASSKRTAVPVLHRPIAGRYRRCAGRCRGARRLG